MNTENSTNKVHPQDSAFPTIIYDTNTAGDSHPREIYYGLTKRELFAAMALQGICANSMPHYAGLDSDKIAQWSVTQADALIAELNKSK